MSEQGHGPRQDAAGQLPMEPAAVERELRACAQEFRALGSRQGIPEVVQTPGDSLPHATTGHVVYDLGVALCLALGDLAEALDVEADRAVHG